MRFETKLAHKLVLTTAVSTMLLSALTGCGAMDDTDRAMANTGHDSPSTTSSSAPAPSSSTPSARANSDSPSNSNTATPRSVNGAVSASESCKAASLSLALGSDHGAAGTTYQSVVFTNTGHETCTLKGYPGASYVNGPNGKQIGQPAQRTGPAGSLVTLAPGSTAKADVGFTRVGFYDANECKPTPVRGLRIYAPGDRAAMFVATQGQQGCAGNVPGSQLKVTSMHQ